MNPFDIHAKTNDCSFTNYQQDIYIYIYIKGTGTNLGRRLFYFFSSGISMDNNKRDEIWTQLVCEMNG
jgi:hypothetical protein